MTSGSFVGTLLVLPNLCSRLQYPLSAFERPSSSTPFVFQAEDGIRDFHVTGVQTCALPILGTRQAFRPSSTCSSFQALTESPRSITRCAARSEERRVGKECRYRRPLDL